LGAAPELSRLYMHLGLFLLKQKVDGKDRAFTNDSIEKARFFFNEMKLEWDLAEMERKVGQLTGVIRPL
jgi:hypothetical protein